MTSDLTLRPSELRQLAAEFIKAQKPMLIVGAPGVGKTDIIGQAAHDVDAELMVSHPVISDPTDAKGMPWVVDGHATFLPFGDLERAFTATRRTCWLLDDLAQAAPATQASYMQPLIAHSVNGQPLSPYVTIIAASNRRTDKAGVSGMLEPVKSRFFTIAELEPTVDDWCLWAIDRNVSPLLIAFLRFMPDLLCKFNPTADMTNSPVPRTWAHVAAILEMSLSPNLQHKAIAGAVGQGAAVELAAFIRTWQQLPNIDQILIDPDSVAIPDSPAVLYAVATALASKTTATNFPRIAKYVTRMASEGSGEFGVLTIRDCLRRCKEITATTAYVGLSQTEVGKLINGDPGGK